MKVMAFFILFFTQIAFAQNTDEYEKGFKAGQASAAKNAPVAEPEVVPVPEKTLREKIIEDRTIVRDPNAKPSEEMRTKKSYEAAISWGPDYQIVTNQLIFSKFMTPQDVIGLKFGYGKDEEGDIDITQLNISIQYKKFLSNTFYVSPEIVYLKIDETQDDYNYGQNNNFYRGGGVGFRIGNQLHLKNFTIGCDWIGLGTLLVSTENTDHLKGYATLLNTYIGWSF